MNFTWKRSVTLFVLLKALLLGLIVLAAPNSEAAPALQANENKPATIYLRSRTLTPGPEARAPVSDPQRPQRWHGLIQLSAIPDAGQRAELAAVGVTLHGYIPEHTWLATMPRDLTPVYKLAYVHWTGPLQPHDRLDPALHEGRFDKWAINEDGTVDLWVDVFADVSLEEASATIASIGGTVTQVLPDFGRLHVTLLPAQVGPLAMEDGLKWITQAPPPQRTLNDGSRAVIQADVVQASPYNLTGSGVRAGLWDAGIADQAHPDLAQRLTIVETDVSTTNHATHVAGILGGNGLNSTNYNGTEGQWRGVAPGMEIFSFYWDSPSSDHDLAINTYGIDVSHNSWSLGGCNFAGRYDSYAADYDQIVTGIYGRTIPVVFAAGNLRGTCAEQYGTVSGGGQSAKNSITVGGISSTDSSMMQDSSWGPVEDGRLKPDVVAAGQTMPGMGIRSTIIGGGYGGYSGTSMAAPAVSGSVGLVLEQYRSLCQGDSSSDASPQPSTIKALLIHSADDLADPQLTYFNPGPDYSSGYGRVNDQNAVELVTKHHEGAVTQGDVESYSLFVGEGESSLKVTLVWDDVAAEPNAAKALVNDLDLELIAPDGNTVYGPWILNPAKNKENKPALRYTWAFGEAGERDTLNVVEQVVVDAPESGMWTARVVGTNIPFETQSYSIVGKELQRSSCSASPTVIAGLHMNAGSSANRITQLLLLALLVLFIPGTIAAIIYHTRTAPLS